jgi:hypothetical protein
MMAGGGIRGGYVHGAFDRMAAGVTSDLVSPEDLLATLYHLLRFDPKTPIHDLQGLLPWWPESASNGSFGEADRSLCSPRDPSKVHSIEVDGRPNPSSTNLGPAKRHDLKSIPITI